MLDFGWLHNMCLRDMPDIPRASEIRLEAFGKIVPLLCLRKSRTEVTIGVVGEPAVVVLLKTTVNERIV